MGNKKIVENYEPFGDYSSDMADAFEFVAKTPGGANLYKGRAGTQFQDLNFITDPTTQTSSIYLSKNGQLIPTEMRNLNPKELYDIRNNIIIQSAQKAERKAFRPIDTEASGLEQRIAGRIAKN